MHNAECIIHNYFDAECIMHNYFDAECIMHNSFDAECVIILMRNLILWGMRRVSQVVRQKGAVRVGSVVRSDCMAMWIKYVAMIARSVKMVVLRLGL